MYELLNNLIINFNDQNNIKKIFEDLGLIFDEIDNNDNIPILSESQLYKVNQESNINFGMIIMFLEEMQSLESFILKKINNIYYLNITDE